MISRALPKAEAIRAAERNCPGPVLGLDTATTQAVVGLIAHGRVVSEQSPPATGHGALLPEAVEQVLGACGVSHKDVAAVAVGMGPGSFTGLRVGLSYVKGLALGLGLKVVGVPTLDSIAMSALERGGRAPGTLVCPVLDAKRGEVYTALYRVGADEIEKLTDDLVITLQDLLSRIRDEVIFAGDAGALAALAAATGNRFAGELVTLGALASRGGWVARLGLARLVHGETEDAATVEPLYVRRAQAALGRASATLGETGIWSQETRNSSGSMRSTTRS